MPLNTEIKRNGETLKVRWGGFHVVAMTIAAAVDSDWKCLFKNDVRPEKYPFEPIPVGPSDVFHLMDYVHIGMTPLNDGPYTLKSPHKFLDTADGEVFELLAGDVLIAGRS